MHQINTLIWDWNGTLLDDTDICIETINVLLTERNIPNIDRQQYLTVFGFPVKDYYQRIGFDFENEPFEIPAHRYIEIYSSKLEQCQLHNGVLEVLNIFKQRGLTQLILSASEQQLLEHSLQLFGIEKWFASVAGLNNHFAQSKTEIGKRMLNDMGISPSEACLIGDTTHDFDVAATMGCQCILIANGHQTAEKLEETGALVLPDMKELPKVFRAK